MTLEEFKKKYKFAASMSVQEINYLLMFIMNILMQISMGIEGDEKILGIFLDDVKLLQGK